MIKEKIKGQKQLNHVTLTPTPVVGNKSLCFAQNILAKYGISRTNSNFPALVFRYFLSLLTGTAEGENSGSAEVIKRVVDRLNIYHTIADRTGKINRLPYAGNAEPAPMQNLSSPQVIKRVAGHLNIYNYITSEAGKTNQPSYTGSAPAPVLFNAASVWITYVKEKYFKYAAQRAPWENISNFAAKQGNANKVASRLENAFPLKRVATDWRRLSIQECNNLTTLRIYNSISAAGLPGYSPLGEESVSGRERSSGIQLTCLIQNIRSIDQRILFDTLPETSSNHGDVKPALQNTAREGSVTGRDNIEQRERLLKPVIANAAVKINSTVLITHNIYNDLHNLPERGPDAKTESSFDKGIARPDGLQKSLITEHRMTAAIRDGRMARTSNPPVDVREERFTVNHQEIMQQDRLIFSKHVVKETYDVEAAQLSGRPLKQREEVSPASPNIPGQLQDTANRIPVSFSKRKIVLTVKNHVTAAITDSSAAREFGSASSARKENLTEKYDAGNRIKLHYKNEVGNETRGEDIVNQGEISDPVRYKEAVRQGGLILHKLITRETATAKGERMPQAALPVEKKANTRTVNTQKQLQNIHDMGSEEINLLAERVFKVLEKRIVIQKDRRGLL